MPTASYNSSTSFSSKEQARSVPIGISEGVEYTGDKGYKLSQVKSGEISLDDFVAQLDLEELEAITRGAYIMNSPLGAEGNAGTYGGVLPSLRDKGVPAVTTTDGPSGIRLSSENIKAFFRCRCLFKLL